MSPRIVQLRLSPATSRLDRRAGAATEWRRTMDERIALAAELTRICAQHLGVAVDAALQDVGDRCVFGLENVTPQQVAAATVAVEREALTRAGGRFVPVLAVLDADPAADANQTMTALDAADAHVARTPFASLLRTPDAFGPFAPEAPTPDAPRPRDGGAPIACVAIAIDPLRPAPAGEAGACSFLTWLLLQQAEHDLLDGIVAHHAERFAPSHAFVCGDRALFTVELRHALAFVEALANDAANEWRTSISIALTFARDRADRDEAGSRAWSALEDAIARGQRGSLVVDDVRLELASIPRQRELATGLELLARRAPGPVRELAIAATRLSRARHELDIGELARLRGAIHALAAKSGANARRSRPGHGGDPAVAALAALVAESARGFESGEAILPLSYAVWMSSMCATETKR
ncbi:MAG: hypothetical protein IPH13_22830 [Planctomycetes bacterium]|nr:hypothetical protein [Planctomycetota bacterium]MCC7169377.1 hypothetical protein [Planctomycetota bacterium]